MKIRRIPDLYYYTTVETMRFILLNGNIYATDLKYMNDADEYVNGLRELRTVLNAHYGKDERDLISEEMLNDSMRGHSEIYSISFSVERDLLSQWSMYARESGVSLRMDFNKPQQYFAYVEHKNGQSKDKLKQLTNLNLYPRKVYYFTKDSMKKNDYNKVKKEIISDIEIVNEKIVVGDIDSNVLDIWQNTTPYVKRYEFHAEGEYRLAFSMMRYAERFRIDYRCDKHVMKPYLDVTCLNGWPIKEIIVGPGFNQQVVYDSICHFMSHAVIKVPLIDKTMLKKRCEIFWKCNGVIPSIVKEKWDNMYEKLKHKGKEILYDGFVDLHREIMSMDEIDKEYKSYISNRYLSKEGILVGKSEIPYIY